MAIGIKKCLVVGGYRCYVPLKSPTVLQTPFLIASQLQEGGTSPKNETGSNGVDIENRQHSFFIAVDFLREAINLYRKQLKCEDFSIDVQIEDYDTMRQLNKDTREIDAATDILSFPEYTRHTKKDFWKNRQLFLSSEYKHMGDIFMCPEYINQVMQKDVKQLKGNTPVSKSGGVSQRMTSIQNLNLRLCYLVAHGILHLMGFDHEDENDSVEMIGEEDKLLDALEASGLPDRLRKLQSG